MKWLVLLVVIAVAVGAVALLRYGHRQDEECRAAGGKPIYGGDCLRRDVFVG